MKISYYVPNENNALEVNVDATTLEGFHFDGMNLHRVDLRNAFLNGASFVATDLRNAYLMDADAIGCDFSNASLVMADLQRAKLRKSTFHCLLYYANFDHADLSGADFSGAAVKDTHFEDCDLRGAIMLAENLDSAHFAGAKFDKHTVWPEGFSPLEHGAILIGDGKAHDAC
ncbi:pentapeptide repeat-containing protein [Granulicella sp. S156]|uniref:pentapeptide repeat-containing protein n=1 Tax=Granulicella sp. S156 TaxID=1747224 RepID=UPI00131DA65F|nr:pentapeptide repeat-containing protein [Granulicella sp. S156]